MATELVSRDQRIPPSRGLIVTRNWQNAPYALRDLQRWLRYNRLGHKADKVDLLVNTNIAEVLDDLLPLADELEVALSIRTTAQEAPPQNLADLKERGLLDVFLCPPNADLNALAPWFEACRDAQLPVRLQLQAPFAPDTEPEALAQTIADAAVVRLNIAATDPFQNRSGSRNRSQSQADLDFMQQLAVATEARGVEANLLGIPLCLVNEESLARAQNAPQSAADHAHYLPDALDLAQQLYNKGPILTGKVIIILLARQTFMKQPMDNLLLPMILRNHYTYLLSRVYRRLTNHLRIARSVPKEITRDTYDKELADSRKQTKQQLGPVCGKCALKRICEHETAPFKKAFPGLTLNPHEGDHVVSPLHFCAKQPKYYDPLDQLRLESEERYEEIAEDAAKLITNAEPDLLVGPHDYAVEETHFDIMESGLKWWSVSNIEKLSTPIGKFQPPLTMSVDFGAGIADYVGFSFGRHCKIVCPMEAYRHNLTIYIDADGRYVLLRDKRPVRPAEFEGQHYLPLRLADKLEPRISIWNIDECIATQNLRVWTGDETEKPDLTNIKYSIVIVSTRFTRRLHAVLRSLAHQKDFDLNRAEVIICYVPGIDAADDLIDGVTLTYPDLHIVRSPFPEKYMNSKGFLINESAKVASGEWIMLLDSDTLLPPDYLAKVDAASDDAEFIAPDGRKLLPKDITAQILMGELDPWDHWTELLEGSGEFRHRETRGIPVGFCQTFRAKYLERFPYLEVDHFETADMQFGEQMRHFVGEEHRLSGTPVIHLDHGGSQWYGTQKHM